MTSHLYLAPAGHGKTTYVLKQIRQIRAVDPLASIIVILPNQAQVNAFRQRLSASGGALGVNLGTFYALYPEILAWAGKPEPRLPEPVQYRLLHNIVVNLIDEGRLPYYAPLRDKPGFVVALRALLEELKRAGIRREAFKQAIQTLSERDTRLTELAELYTVYQDWLLDYNWADTEGQGWLAALVLERQPDLGRHLRLLIVDGFDEFNPTQLAVLKFLAGRAAETIITLTGSPSSVSPDRGRPALRRFTRALQTVSQALKLKPEPLPEQIPSPFAPALAHLEAHLFNAQAPRFVPSGRDEDGAETGQETITFLEAQNRAEEVRAALRWLKARLVRDQMAPAEVALIARDLSPYRPFIEETAVEFGLVIHLREGLNLATNPAIAAIISLLALPLATSNGEGNWARRPLIDAWRSPYFENLAPDLARREADRLDLVARQGLVMQGLDQWRAALNQQVSLASSRADTASPLTDEDLTPPDQLSLTELLALQNAFEAFVTRITPPPQATLRQYAAFVEDLIGDDPKLSRSNFQARSGPQSAFWPLDYGPARANLDVLKLTNQAPSPSRERAEEGERSVGIVNRAWAVPATAPRDIAALRAFKDVLRGLVLAESSLAPEARPMSYDRFYEELRGAVQGATYYPPPPRPLERVLPVLSVLNARGLSFRAVALIGLAEGDFPRSEREDILLREENRQALRQAGLTTLESHLRGDEITFFYQAITRAREKLFLGRPYLAADGHTWEPSPYWQEVHRLIDAPAQHLRPEDPLPLSQVASWQEFAQALSPGNLDPELSPHLLSPPTQLTNQLRRSLAILRARLAAEPQGRFEGDLTDLSERFSSIYGPDQVWSSSRLEAYGLCPHHFWLGQDLALESHQPPEEGFDVFILGSMYHEILEEVYRQAGEQADGERLLELLPAVAKAVFDKAPATYGFRPTPLWEIQRPELEQILAQTIVALAEATANSTPMAQEQVFGMRGQPPLVVRQNGDEFRVRGFIDRVDQDSDGRLRIIDYKSGSTPITARDLAEGRRLQIALYALAAREALALGDIADGFYWHIGSAKASSLKLEKYEGGVEGALKMAIAHAFNHIAGVRAGCFPPSPPPAGCPGHCPGASFCWRYKAKGW